MARAPEPGLIEAAPTATEIINHVAAEHTPIVSITTEDGVKHRLWRLGHPDEQDAILAELAAGLIADGHHRYAAYLDLQADQRASGLGAGPWDYGLAFLVDSGQCRGGGSPRTSACNTLPRPPARARPRQYSAALDNHRRSAAAWSIAASSNTRRPH